MTMEDIAAKLSDILGGTEGGEKVSQLLSSLGMGESGGSPGVVDFGALLGMLGGLGGEAGEESEANPSRHRPSPGPSSDFSGLDPRLLGTLARAMRSVREPDQNTRLLQALRPYLEPERRQKTDEAVKILQLLKLAPLIQETGILGGLLGGDDQP